MVPSDHELNSTRTILASPIERFLVAPCGINYHLEHHMFPSVPGYRLHKLHALLMEDPQFRDRAHITHGYWHPRHGLLGELLTPAPEMSSAATSGMDQHAAAS